MMEGRRLADRFLVLKTLGAGGATEVSLTQDERLGEWVAVRVLTDSLADQSDILRDVCRDTRQLAHPNIARVFDFYRSEGTAFICREYVEGASVSDFAGRSSAESLIACAEVAAALESAHGLGVVHGDLKASKILRDVRGNVRVIDFRVASAFRSVTPPATAGDHLSPQVRMGESPVSADDIFSLGCLIQQMIASKRAPQTIIDLVGAMLAESRNWRPTDLSEIGQALAASASGDAQSPNASHSAPPVLRPPLAIAVPRNAPPIQGDASGSSRNLQYAIASGALALLALIVFFVLPRWVESPDTPEPQSNSGELIDGEKLARSREAPTVSKSGVESLLVQLIAIRDQLQASAVDRWAADDFARARELEGRGDTAFIEHDFSTALTNYREALAIFEALSQQRGDALAASLEAGTIALEDGDQQRAIDAFDLAMAIEPSHAEALAGAQRAEGLGARMAHMSAGRALEAEDALNLARDEYAKAVEIDPQYAPAREALERTQVAIADSDYESSLALAVVSMAKDDLRNARAHFEKARALRPNSPEVIAGLRQLQQTESSRAITSMRKRAEVAEAAENWSEAASLYQTIIDTQDNLSFAEEGLQRNRELTRTTDRIAKLLEDPTQLFRPATLEEAHDLAEFGKRSAAGKPKLAEQVRLLEIAARLASTPISVVFESDTATEVVIRGMGTLGNFSRRDVPLKPGRYVVVGRRDGYRDTRSEISVIPGRQQPVVEVRCTEKI